MTCPDDNTLASFAAGEAKDRALVEAHLDTCAECLAIVCEAARVIPEVVSPMLRDEAAPEVEESVAPAPRKRGTTVGRYTLLAMLGQGAMGSVYSAHDARLDRKVALKLLRADRPEATRERLAREARAMARVAHSNVVRVYDAGEIDEGVFLAMELVDGKTLGAWLRDPRPWREVLEAFLAAGRGLAAAHAVDIVHRDFKPENVLVDRHGRVAVSDFGLAELTESDATLTRRGTRLGTPLYMSPEQHRGERVDARSDQFSFAVALYAALYGEHPFAQTSRLEDLRDRVERGAIRPLTSRKGVPSPMRKVLLRALATAPRDRYAGMNDVLEHLEAASRKRFPLAALAVPVGAALGAVVLLLARPHHEPAPVAIAPPTPVVSTAAEPTVSSAPKRPLEVRIIPDDPLPTRRPPARAARSAAASPPAPPVPDAAVVAAPDPFPSSRK